MCGIFGAVACSADPLPEFPLQDMSASIRHRGPDADGIARYDHATIGNRRLSILDLSDASNQPLYSADGHIALVQNGEIYNFIELREELSALGAQFATTGDTEVLLRAYEHWGPGFVERLNGMFAIAVHDSRTDTTWLYRDRLGVKPLYLAEHRGALLFASEIKALLRGGVPAVANPDALAQFFALNYIPAPDTAFQGIRHLPPAHVARIDRDGIEIRAYWDLNDQKPARMDTVEAIETLTTFLDDATRLRLRSDAKFGAFLSGGLDSSSVLAAMAAHLGEGVKTFCIGFDDPKYDEAPFAKMAAEMFGADHAMERARADIATLWPRFIWHVDQPHGDVSFMPTDLVSRLAARQVKMVLTGDGGDELFAGYEKYLNMFPGGRTDHLQPGWEGDVVRGAGLLLDDQPSALLAGDLRAAFHDTDPFRRLSGAIAGAEGQDPINRVLLAETQVLLPGNNLVKPDRMAMANSLEVRSPFLDYRMAEFAFQVPGALKLAGGETKAIYKQAMLPVLGEELTYRKKQMFTVPVGDWFRGALEPFCRQMFFDGRLGARGILNMDTLGGMLDAHVAGTANYTRQLRAVVSLELWYRLFIDGDDVTLAAATC